MTAVALSPIMPWVATGSMDRSVKVWRIGDVSSRGKTKKNKTQRTDWVLAVELGCFRGAAGKRLQTAAVTSSK